MILSLDFLINNTQSTLKKKDLIDISATDSVIRVQRGGSLCEYLQ